MVVRGYLIQAITHEPVLFWLAMAHLATGTVFATVQVLHQVIARSRAPRV